MVLPLSLSLAMLQGGLQAEVRSVQLPQGQTVLVVGPERIPATDGGSGAGLPGIAKRYGRMLYTSGSVVSLAPATMKTILAPPKEPNPFLGLNPRDAFKLLAARLDGRQWSALVDKNGLGVSDLKSTDERFLFEALVKPGGELLIFPSVVNRSESQAEKIDLTASAAQSRLRLGTTIQPMIPDGVGGFMGSVDSVSYNVDLGEAAPDGKIMGGEAARTSPNRLKESQLDYASGGFKREVDLSGVKTAGDLVAEIAKVSGTELYADLRFSRLPVVVTGQTKGLASDLLRALAVGVAGTFRRVGDAYVLTDSLAGVGALRERWGRFVEAGYARRREEQKRAEDYLLTGFDRGSVRSIPGALDYTPDQRSRANREVIGEVSGLEVPYKSLSPAQQKAVQNELQENPDSGAKKTISGEDKIYLSQHYRLDLLHPELGAPAAYSTVPDFLTRRPVPPTPPQSSGKSVKVEFERFAHRAAILSPEAMGDATLLDILSKSGVKTIWLDSDGSDLTAMKPAVDAIRAKGFVPGLRIDVYPVSTPGGDSDRTIGGEASSQPRPDSATALALQSKIAAAVSTLGVDSVLIKRPFPSGYSRLQFVGTDDARPPLGYTPEARLAFLRAQSADPIDVYLYRTPETDAELSLEMFDDVGAEWELDNAWNEARYERLEKSLGAFCSRLSPKVRCVVTATRSAIGGAWFTEWNGVGQAPGGTFKDWRETFEPKGVIGAWQKATGHPVFYPVGFGKGTTVDMLAQTFAYYAATGAQGITLDLRGVKPGDDRVLKLLQSLSR